MMLGFFPANYQKEKTIQLISIMRNYCENAKVAVNWKHIKQIGKWKTNRKLNTLVNSVGTNQKKKNQTFCFIFLRLK